MFMGVLGHITGYDTARPVVKRLVEALPPGSYVVVADGTDADPAYVAAIDQYNSSGAIPHLLRSPEDIAGFLDGLEIVQPGVVPCPRWRPDDATPGTAAGDCTLCGVGHKT